MKIRSALAVGLSLVITLAAPAGAASATPAAVPPSALPACSSQASSIGLSNSFGGWDRRDVQTSGTDSEDPRTVRPRNLRLGEACVGDGELGPAGEIVFPFQATDLPTVGEYEPPSSGGWDRVCGIGGNTNLCIEFVGYAVNGSNKLVCFQVSNAAGSSVANLTSVPMSMSRVGSTSPVFDGNVQARTDNVNANYTNCRSAHAEVPLPTSLVSIVISTTAVDYELAGYRVGGWTTGGPIAGEADTGGAGWGDTQGGPLLLGGDLDGTGRVECSSAYQGPTTSTHTMAFNHRIEQDWVPSFSPADVDHELPNWRNTDTFTTGQTTSGCAYVVRIVVVVCFWIGVPEGDAECVTLTWDAEAWRTHTPYPDAGDQEAICEQYPDEPGCYEVLNPPIVDGTDFEQVCLPLPEDAEPAWLDFGWLLPWVQHMTVCLFVPANGFDRLGHVAASWEASALGEVGGLVAAVADTASVGETCGVIADGTDTAVPIAIDTCSWSWAPGMKIALTWAVVIGFGFFAVSFVVRVVLSIPNKKVVDPTQDWEDRRLF